MLPIQYEPLLLAALAEDIGAGDITTLATVPPGTQARAVMFAKGSGTVAGLTAGLRAFTLIEPTLRVIQERQDGDTVAPRRTLALIEGDARAILTAERVALNVVQQLSGIATLTAQFVQAVQGTGTDTRIVDTRKTTPGLRTWEKYAVRMGGGHNHRIGLYDAVLIKDNHLAAGGGVAATVLRARQIAPHTMRVEVECKSLSQVDEAIAVGADIILLDNMSLEMLADGVRKVRESGKPILTEASGGVNLSTVAQIARTGVDIISVGALTHSAPALDISLDFELP